MYVLIPLLTHKEKKKSHIWHNPLNIYYSVPDRPQRNKNLRTMSLAIRNSHPTEMGKIKSYGVKKKKKVDLHPIFHVAYKNLYESLKSRIIKC